MCDLICDIIKLAVFESAIRLKFKASDEIVMEKEKKRENVRIKTIFT